MKRNNIMIYIMMLGTFGILNTDMGIVGILPEVTQYFNVSLADAGLLVSLFSLVISITSLFLPLLFSRFDRKNTFVMVLAIFTVFNFIGAFITDFTLALICRLIPAIFYPVYCALTLSVAGEIADKGKEQEAIGTVMMGVSSGMILGVPITTYIGSNFGYQYSMIWFALITLIVLIITVVYFPPLPGRVQSYGTQISVLKSVIFIISLMAVILLYTGMYTSYSYISDFLGTILNIKSTNLSIILFIYGIASITGNYVSAKLLQKVPNKIILLLPLLFILIFIIVFNISNYPSLLVIIILFWGLFAGMGNNVSQYLMVSAAPHASDLANGIFLSMSNLGVTIGTAIAGMIVMNIGVQFVMLAAIVILIIELVLVSIRTKKRV